MRLRVVDRKKNEMIDIKVEVDKYTFIVAPDIINEKFNYLKKRRTPNTVPRIWQSSTMMGSISSFSGWRRT